MSTCCTPDFNEMDFYGEDFDTLRGSGFRFRDFLFSRLPVYFVGNDTYKDSEDKGLLERYLSVFGYELDFELIPQLECYLEIIDASICKPEYLDHISDVLGNPPDIFQDETIYRNLLRYILSVYKIKGTLKAYELFFSILGFTIELEEIPPIQEESNYDQDGLYDQGTEESIYDQDRCEPCSLYKITFFPKDPNNTDLTFELLSKLNDVIVFNEPINAKLDNLTYSIDFQEEISISATDSHTTLVEALPLYDELIEYDEEDVYDTVSTLGEDVLQTQMLVNVNPTLVDTNTSEYPIAITLIDNFDPVTLDIAETLITIEARDVNGELIYSAEGTIINLNYDPGEIMGLLISPLHEITGASSINISGHITLSDDKVALLDNNISPSGQTALTLNFL